MLAKSFVSNHLIRKKYFAFHKNFSINVLQKENLMSENFFADKMLTTIDNPYNPHTQFDEWDAFDRSKGYCTNQYMARLMIFSDSLSDAENNENYENAMKEILDYDPIGIYRLIGPNEEIKAENIEKANAYLKDALNKSEKES